MVSNKNHEVIILSENKTKVTLLKDLLSRYYSISVAFVCRCAAEAIECLNHHRPMIFFLDLSFAEVLHDVRKPPFIVGLCDTLNTKRIKQYLKMGFFEIFFTPYTEGELNSIMGKVLNIYGTYNKLDYRMIQRVEEESAKYYANESAAKSMFLMGSRSEESIRIVFDQVLFMRKEGNHVCVHFEDGSSKFFRSNLKVFHIKFPQHKFQKINKSVVVNMDKVTGVDKNRVVIADNANFEVSRSFKKPFKELLLQ